jgi:hypothetical protein
MKKILLIVVSATFIAGIPAMELPKIEHRNLLKNSIEKGNVMGVKQAIKHLNLTTPDLLVECNNTPLIRTINLAALLSKKTHFKAVFSCYGEPKDYKEIIILLLDNGACPKKETSEINHILDTLATKEEAGHISSILKTHQQIQKGIYQNENLLSSLNEAREYNFTNTTRKLLELGCRPTEAELTTLTADHSLSYIKAFYPRLYSILIAYKNITENQSMVAKTGISVSVNTYLPVEIIEQIKAYL